MRTRSHRTKISTPIQDLPEAQNPERQDSNDSPPQKQKTLYRRKNNDSSSEAPKAKRGRPPSKSKSPQKDKEPKSSKKKTKESTEKKKSHRKSDSLTVKEEELEDLESIKKMQKVAVSLDQHAGYITQTKQTPQDIQPDPKRSPLSNSSGSFFTTNTSQLSQKYVFGGQSLNRFLRATPSAINKQPELSVIFGGEDSIFSDDGSLDSGDIFSTDSLEELFSASEHSQQFVNTIPHENIKNLMKNIKQEHGLVIAPLRQLDLLNPNYSVFTAHKENHFDEKQEHELPPSPRFYESPPRSEFESVRNSMIAPYLAYTMYGEKHNIQTDETKLVFPAFSQVFHQVSRRSLTDKFNFELGRETLNLVHDGEAAPESEKLVVRERSWSLSREFDDQEEEKAIEMEENNDKPDILIPIEIENEPLVIHNKVIVQPDEDAMIPNENVIEEESEAVYEGNPAVPMPLIDNENYPETLSLKLIPDTMLNLQIPAQNLVELQKLVKSEYDTLDIFSENGGSQASSESNFNWKNENMRPLILRRRSGEDEEDNIPERSVSLEDTDGSALCRESEEGLSEEFTKNSMFDELREKDGFEEEFVDPDKVGQKDLKGKGKQTPFGSESYHSRMNFVYYLMAMLIITVIGKMYFSLYLVCDKKSQ